MAHTPKPTRKASKAARRQRGPRDRFGLTVSVDEMWMTEASESGWALIKNHIRAGRLPRAQAVHRVEIDHKREYLEFVERSGGMPVVWQHPSDLGRECLGE